MRKIMLGIVTGLLAGAGLAQGQEQGPAGPSTPGPLLPSRQPAYSSYLGYPGAAGMQQATQAPLAPEAAPGYGAMPAQNGCGVGCGSGCGGGGFNCGACCDGCRVHGWFGADYLLWFTPGQHLPGNLVTTPPTIAAPGTVLGGNPAYNVSNGLRINTGIWMDSCERLGAMTQIDTVFRTYSTVNVPAGNLLNTTFNGQPLSFVLDGNGLQYQSWSQFNNVDTDTILRVLCNNNTRVYALAGTKVMYLEEDISLNYSSGGVSFLDEFHTRNTFFGGEIGLYGQHLMGRLSVDAAAKLALGAMFNNITILGKNNGGLRSQVFTNDANIGYRENTYFSVAPEFVANAYYHLTERIWLRIGYNFMLYTGVTRPWQYIIQNNSAGPGLNLFPNTQPAFAYQNSTFVIHGLNFGAVLKY
jgi:hypothetical protein